MNNYDGEIENTENFIFAVTGLAEAYGEEILINNNLHVDMKEVA